MSAENFFQFNSSVLKLVVFPWNQKLNGSELLFNFSLLSTLHFVLSHNFYFPCTIGEMFRRLEKSFAPLATGINGITKILVFWISKDKFIALSKKISSLSLQVSNEDLKNLTKIGFIKKLNRSITLAYLISALGSGFIFLCIPIIENLQFFIYCYGGQLVIDSSLQVAENLYEAEKDLMIIIGRSQKSSIIKSWFYKTDLETFRFVLSSTASLITFVKSLA